MPVCDGHVMAAARFQVISMVRAAHVPMPRADAGAGSWAAIPTPRQVRARLACHAFLQLAADSAGSGSCAGDVSVSAVVTAPAPGPMDLPALVLGRAVRDRAGPQG